MGRSQASPPLNVAFAHEPVLSSPLGTVVGFQQEAPGDGMGVLTAEGEITGDGQLLVELPPGVPRGKVTLTLEVPSEDDLEVSDEDLRGLDLTAAEIAAAPEIGTLADDPEIPSGAEFVERLRAAKRRYRW